MPDLFRASRLMAFGLCFSLWACQPNSPHVSPSPSANSALDEAEYSQAFVKIFDDFSADTQKTAQAPGLESLRAPALTQPLPSSGSSSNAALSDSALPNPEPDSQVPPSSALPQPQLEIMVQLLKAQQKSLSEFQAELKALKPPSSFAAKHALLLEYFELSATMSALLLQEIEHSGTEILRSSVAPKLFTEGAAQADYQRLLELQPQAQSVMAELQLEAFRQLRLPQQQGAALSEDAYQEIVREAFPQISQLSPMLLLMSGLSAPPSEGGEHDNNADFMLRLQNQNSALLTRIGALHPPAEYETGHTALFALLHLQGRLLDLMASTLGDASSGDAPPNPQGMLAELVTQTEFFSLMSKVAVLTPAYDELLAQLQPEGSPRSNS